MRHKIKSDPLRAFQLGAPLFQQMKEIVPDCVRENGTAVWLDIFVDDPRLDVVVNMLAEHGFRSPLPGESVKDVSKIYLLTKHTVFDKTDYLNAEYFTVGAEDHFGYCLRSFDADETVLLDSKSIRKRAAVAYADHAILVPQRVRDELEAQKFIHLTFLETLPARYSGSAMYDKILTWSKFDPEHRWWEVWSDLLLPPTAPSTVRTDGDSTIVPRDWDGWQWLACKPGTDDPRYHYLEHEFRAAGPFDVALTSERRVSKRFRTTVVSKRFMDFVSAKGWKWLWTPVVLDKE